MAMFALYGILPFLAYALVQTARDARRKSWIMALWGAAISGLLAYAVVQAAQSTAP